MLIGHIVDTLGRSKGYGNILIPQVRLLHESVFIYLDIDVTMCETRHFGLL
jgi:hypothetical protein